MVAMAAPPPEEETRGGPTEGGRVVEVTQLDTSSQTPSESTRTESKGGSKSGTSDCYCDNETTDRVRFDRVRQDVRHDLTTRQGRRKKRPDRDTIDPGDSEVTAAKLSAFLTALSQTLSVREACQIADVGVSTVYRHRSKNRRFRRLWDDAQEAAIQRLEDALYQRALAKDTVAGIFLLKGARPEKYRDNVAVTGADGGPIRIRFVAAEDTRK